MSDAPGRHRPHHGGEGRLHRTAVRAAAVLAGLVTLAYLGWRVTATLAGTTWWLAAGLLLLELHALASLALHAFDLWDLDPVPPPDPAPGRAPRVAVLIPTYNEPREVLLPTIAAAVALRPAHETWVLDDGARPWVAELAAGLGARYRARTTHEHAKAGNINAVLPDLTADLVAIFDADHIAHGDFLTRTLPYFADPGIALVQTPQDFYNVDSFEHVSRRRGRRFGEQELFYRAISAGRNRWNAAFWCGTNAVVRLSALRSVGGVATGTVTEDIHTTIRLHRRGWRTVYVNEVLAQGLAAGTIDQYLAQRLRWGTGAMQVLRTDNPARGPGLRLAQRIGYLSTLLGWFDSWRTLGYLALPVLVALTGGLPVTAPLGTFLPWFAAVLLTQRLALRLLARGHATVWHTMLFEIIRLPANLRATLTLAGRRQRAFTVTAKGRSADTRDRLPAPRLLVALLAAQLGALAWYAATLAHRTPVHYAVPWNAHGAALWLALNTVLVGTAVVRIRATRYGPERRAGVRFRMDAPASIGGHPARLEDASLTGASVLVRGGDLQPGQPVRLAAAELDLTCVVRSVRPADPPAGLRTGRHPAGAPWLRIRLEYHGLAESTEAALALTLFGTGLVPSVSHQPADGFAA